MLEVTVRSFLCGYMKLLVPESIFCPFTKTLEHKVPFLTGKPMLSISWNCSLSFLPSLFILTLLLFHSAFSVFPCFFFLFFFPSLPKWLFIKHMQPVIYGLMWGNILLNPSNLTFNSDFLKVTSPSILLLSRNDSFVESFRTNKYFLFIWHACQSLRLLLTYFRLWPMNCRQNKPQGISII